MIEPTGTLNVFPAALNVPFEMLKFLTATTTRLEVRPLLHTALQSELHDLPSRRLVTINFPLLPCEVVN